MIETFNKSILKREDFYEGDNSLYNFLNDYILSHSPDGTNIDIFLIDTEEYYLIEIKIMKCDHSLSNFDDVINEIESGEFKHPLIILGSEICESGTFFQLQSMCSQNSYGVSVELSNDETRAEYFNQNFGQNERETLYTIGFRNGVSYAWETIREFVGECDHARYYIESDENDTKRVL